MKKNIAVLFVLVLLTSIRGNAQWSTDPFINTSISSAVDEQYLPQTISDGAGGAIITWMDKRNGSDYDIYAQHIDKAGTVRWTAGGLPISALANDQYFPALVSDGAGGAIITWYDFRSGTSYDIYAQRVNSAGATQWTTNGVAVSTAASNQTDPTITIDGVGGAIITWSDGRSGSSNDIYAQRINASGVGQWTGNGVAISTAIGNQIIPIITNDGSGGAIITWYEDRDGNLDIYAQRVDATGLIHSGWTTNGVAISKAADIQYFPTITGDGAGGAIITWNDFRSGTTYDVYAQRVDSIGDVLWTTNGVAIATASNDQYFPQIVSDGAGGGIISWNDYRGGSSSNIYAQRISGSGVAQWKTDGVPISTIATLQFAPTLTSDGSGGGIITWYDYRNTTSYDIFAQRINNAGLVQWKANGVAVSTAANDQKLPVITGDGSGGAIIAWVDSRNGNIDIYAQNIDRFGYVAINTPNLTKVHDVAGDQGGKVDLVWRRADLDSYPNQDITYYSIWRGVNTSANLSESKIITPEIMTKEFSGDGYRQKETSGGLTNWAWVANVPAHYLSGYDFTAATFADSTAGGIPYYKFFISAQTSNPFIFWDSNIDSGYSADNIAPNAVQRISAQSVSGPAVRLTWDANTGDPDVTSFEVHTSTASDFTPAAGTKIGQSGMGQFTDSSPLTAGVLHYYRIVTVDAHGNKSIPSVQVSSGLPAAALYSLIDKWNLVSVPLTVSDYTKTLLYPAASSNAFAYAGSYSPASVLANAKGYWLKFIGNQTASMIGFLRNTDTVQVAPGWNLIGSISTAVPTANIVSIPGGITTSQFFGYNGAYSPATSIEPGKAYWLKVNQSAKIVLSSAPIASPSWMITIRRSSELPPVPPEGSLSDDQAVPASYSLDQNYPNPFNPTTEIRYAIRDAGFVTLKIYDVLGSEVSTLVNQVEEPGYKTVHFDASKLPSGLYFYRITAGGFTDQKKLMLVK